MLVDAGGLCSTDASRFTYAKLRRPIWPLDPNHLMKVAHDLGEATYIEGVRGRTGGICLGTPADRINVGEVVCHTEEGFELIERVLNRYTLADLLKRRTKLLRLVEAG
eukprot:gene12960-biopygen11374